MRRLLATLLALLLVAAGCGDGEGAEGPDGADAPPSTIAPIEVSRNDFADAQVRAVALSRSLGDPVTAALTVVVAIDRGYSPEQILTAIEDDTLTADGLIARGDGTVAPVGTDRGRVADKTPTPVAPPTYGASAAVAEVESVVFHQSGGGQGVTLDELAAQFNSDIVAIDVTSGTPFTEETEAFLEDVSSNAAVGFAFLVAVIVSLNVQPDGIIDGLTVDDLIFQAFFDPDGFCPFVVSVTRASNIRMAPDCSDIGTFRPGDDSNGNGSEDGSADNGDNGDDSDLPTSWVGEWTAATELVETTSVNSIELTRDGTTYTLTGTFVGTEAVHSAGCARTLTWTLSGTGMSVPENEMIVQMTVTGSRYSAITVGDCPGPPSTTEVDRSLLLSINPDFSIEVNSGLLSLSLEPG